MWLAVFSEDFSVKTFCVVDRLELPKEVCATVWGARSSQKKLQYGFLLSSIGVLQSLYLLVA